MEVPAVDGAGAGAVDGAAAGTVDVSARPRAVSGGRPPLVIGHRGACGYRPEHTLASYELAVRLGADYIEADLVSTYDHVLVARHEPELSLSTDVARRPEFAARRRAATIGGVTMDGWFVEDFTVAEIRTLRAVERSPDLRPRNTLYDGLFGVPTFEEILALRERLSVETGREIGVCAEIKDPDHFRAARLPLEDPLVASLTRGRLDRPDAPLFVQSFDAAWLRDLRERYGLRAPAVLLLGAPGRPGRRAPDADHLSPEGLRELATFATGIGPHKNHVIAPRADGQPGTPTNLVAHAHAAGLVVYAHTMAAENLFLPPALRSGSGPSGFCHTITEQLAYLRAGVDGLVTDHPDITVLVRDMLALVSDPGAAAGVPAGVAGAPAGRAAVAA